MGDNLLVVSSFSDCISFNNSQYYLNISSEGVDSLQDFEGQ